MADNLTTATMQLVDIEAPTAPGMDWLFWASWFAVALLWVIVLFAVFRYGRHFYQPAVLARQLQAFDHACHRQTSEWVDKNRLWSLYGWSLKLALLVDHSNIERTDAFKALSGELKRLAFAKEGVSRETYGALLAQAHALLQPYELRYRVTQLFKRIKSVGG